MGLSVVDFTQSVFRAPRVAGVRSQNVFSDVFGIGIGNPTDDGTQTFNVNGLQQCLGVGIQVIPSATVADSDANTTMSVFLDGERIASYQLGFESFKNVAAWQVNDMIPFNKVIQNGSHIISWSGVGTGISAAGWRSDLTITVFMQEI